MYTTVRNKSHLFPRQHSTFDGKLWVKVKGFSTRSTTGCIFIAYCVSIPGINVLKLTHCFVCGFKPLSIIYVHMLMPHSFPLGRPNGSTLIIHDSSIAILAMNPCLALQVSCGWRHVRVPPDWSFSLFCLFYSSNACEAFAHIHISYFFHQIACFSTLQRFGCSLDLLPSGNLT